MNPRVLLSFILFFAARSLADQPSPGGLSPAMFVAEGGIVFARVNYRNPDENGKFEAYGTVYRLRADGSNEELWRFSGIHTFHAIQYSYAWTWTILITEEPILNGQFSRFFWLESLAKHETQW
jgi:hypothetical protein